MSDSIYSIPIPEIKNDIRRHLNGGIVTVNHRMIAINSTDESLPKAARFAPNGKKFKSIHQEDFSSLYPYTLLKDLPTGPGFHLRKNREKYSLISMDKSQAHVSMESMQWLAFFQMSSGFEVQHAYNRGEKKIGRYSLDGFVENENQTIGLDYRGCR